MVSSTNPNGGTSPRPRPQEQENPTNRVAQALAPSEPEAPATTPATEGAALAAPAAPPDSGSVLSAQPAVPISSREIAVSSAALALWLMLLTAGIVVGTPVYVDAIRNQTVHGFFQVIGYAFVIVTCHTVPNIAMLCCLAAFLGVIGSRAIEGVPASGTGADNCWNAYVSAFTRGFFVFLIIQSGSILLTEEAFTNLTLERYVRLAGLSSLFSFTVGYNPGVFTVFLSRVSNLAYGSTTPATAPPRS